MAGGVQWVEIPEILKQGVRKSNTGAGVFIF